MELHWGAQTRAASAGAGRCSGAGGDCGEGGHGAYGDGSADDDVASTLLTACRPETHRSYVIRFVAPFETLMMIHCHILRHAELGMMFLAQIVAATPQVLSRTVVAATRDAAAPLALSRTALAATKGGNGPAMLAMARSGDAATVAVTETSAAGIPRPPRVESASALLAGGLVVGLAAGIVLSARLRAATQRMGLAALSAANPTEPHPDCCYTIM